MEIEVSGEIWYWRGPAPFHFVAVPDEASAAIRATAARTSYGWGVIPVTVDLAGTTWTTSLFPKDGRYLVPIKDAVRKATGAALGDMVTLRVSVAI
jgi:hypothetical protein